MNRQCVVVVTALALTLGGRASAHASAQTGDPQNEVSLLRATEALEAKGDIAGAERLVRDALTRNPTSLSSLIVLERLLTLQGKVAELEPYIDRLLKVDPMSVIGHQLHVRMFATIDRPDDLQRAADAWISAMPDVETPYREVARTMRSRGDHAGAARILDRGRRRLGGDALALELGDVYADLKDYNRAVTEWGRAIGKDGQGFLPVQRRLQAMPDGGAAAIPALVASLRREPTTTDRKRAAALVALDAGMIAETDQLVKQVYRELPSQEKNAFLSDIARRADAGDMPKLAYWAYGEVLRTDTDPSRTLALRSRYAQLALMVGDTARATKVYQELERASAAGSPQRRQALAARIQLGTARGDIVRAAADLALLRAEFPSAPEVDESASIISAALLEAGDLDGAERALAGVAGARSGATRGRIYLRRGNVEKARTELLAAAPALRGAEATETLILATLIARMSQAGGELIGGALALASDDVAGAVRMLLRQSEPLPPGERAAILDYAAAVADRAGIADLSETVRREIVAKHPESNVAPAALLALAQSAMARGVAKDDARLWLETLIVSYPRSALVPQARRDLDRLLGRVPGR